jgi:hypothetical protein
LDYIISWFYSEDNQLKSHYPQVNMDSTSSKFQEVYWKCIVSFYTSSLKNNKDMKHIFYTNVSEFPQLRKFNLKNFFENNQIEIRYRELSNKTPADWHSAWRNQFFVFDILDDLSGSVTVKDNILILDSDCIVTRDLTELFQSIEKLGAVLYDCGYEDTHVINGVSIEDMRQLFYDYYQERESIRYYGGEFIALRGDLIGRMLEEYSILWSINYKKYESKLKKLTEEAHFLSFIYHRLNLFNITCN